MPVTAGTTTDQLWETDVLPTLEAYTTIPCLSPAYDPDWEAHGHLDRAAVLLAGWAAARLPELALTVVELPGHTPLLLGVLEGTGPTVLIYGHLDKQPPMGAWREGLGPYQPVREGDRLYGRGTGDDGYALFAAVTALRQVPDPPRVVVLIEASEESGSPDLAPHLAHLDLGRPDVVVCLDSGALTYDRLWLTTSLRGIVVATVTVEVLEYGIHSGMAGGVVPSSFRLLRRLLSRIEDQGTGAIVLPALHAEVPEAERRALAAVGRQFPEHLPVMPGLRLPEDPLVLKAWAPALEVTGMDGIPAVADGGNVQRPLTRAKLSIRLPPTVDAAAAQAALAEALTQDPPEGARVGVTFEASADGWLAPPLAPWLRHALDRASEAAFGHPAASYGEGGSIPFLGTLARQFPEAQFVATGVLGPESNAHGPDEFLHLPTAKAVTDAVVEVLCSARAQAG